MTNTRCDDDKPVWLVTGAADGVGRKLAEIALRDGNRVVATAGHLEDLLPLIDDYDHAVIPMELDVNDESADCETLCRVIEILGRVDVVVNAAGYDKRGPIDDARETKRVQTNLFGAVWVCQTALEYMCANGGGRIVQVFGLNGGENYRGRRLYDTAQRVLAEFAEHLAQEGAPFNVKVSVCVPLPLYFEWMDNNRAHRYTLDIYDQDRVDLRPLFPGKPARRAEGCSNQAQSICAPDR